MLKIKMVSRPIKETRYSPAEPTEITDYEIFCDECGEPIEGDVYLFDGSIHDALCESCAQDKLMDDLNISEDEFADNIDGKYYGDFREYWTSECGKIIDEDIYAEDEEVQESAWERFQEENDF